MYKYDVKIHFIPGTIITVGNRLITKADKYIGEVWLKDRGCRYFIHSTKERPDKTFVQKEIGAFLRKHQEENQQRCSEIELE